MLATAAGQGVAVRWLPLAGTGWRGCYHQPTRTIYLRAGMSDRLAVATLMHELEHAARGDDGHQGRAVEARIDRAVACRLITPSEYRAAEALVGPHPGALAVELDVPRWVVDAYRTTLR
ncbi:ImmA/IrrE family metallo-endopeptidase [Actinomyces sp. 432]|nr:ImmA/IrrE family metallo-endopeptidase [Actinomyces sp. 432]